MKIGIGAFYLRRFIALSRTHGISNGLHLAWWKLHSGFGGPWEPWLHDLVLWHGDTFVDVGAHMGQWSLVLAQGYTRVIAIEPNPDVRRALARRSPINVETHQYALWSQEDKLPLYLYPTSELSSLLVNGFKPLYGSPRFSIEVWTKTLDSLHLVSCDFIKVDTEGAEVGVIKGAAETIARCRPHLLIECHSEENLVSIAESFTPLDYHYIIRRCPWYRPGTYEWLNHVWLKAVPREKYIAPYL